VAEQFLNIDELFKAGKPIDDAINKAYRETLKRKRAAPTR